MAVTLSFLRRDQDHAIAGGCAVDCRGSGILEHLDAFNVIGIDGTCSGSDTAIDDIERCRRTVGADAAHLDVRGGARTGRRAVRLNTGSLAGKGGVDVGDAAGFEVDGFHRRHGPREGTLLLDAIADDDHLVQQIRVDFHRDVDPVPVGNDLDRLITDA